MPKRVPTVSVVVIRDGKRVSPPINKGFNFTEDEIKTINGVQPGAIRVPINETASEPAEASLVEATATADTTKAKTGKKGKTKAEKPAPEQEAEDADEDGDADEDEDI